MNTIALAFARAFVGVLPETRLFGLKRRVYAFAGAELSPGVRICSSAMLLGHGVLKVGAGTWIGHQAMIVTCSRVVIGADVDIAPRVFIGTGTHGPGTSDKAAGPGLQREVMIGDGSWIGAGALILPGVKIAKRTTVGAGAVVTRDTREGAVVLGNPARERAAGDGLG